MRLLSPCTTHCQYNLETFSSLAHVARSLPCIFFRSAVFCSRHTRLNFGNIWQYSGCSRRKRSRQPKATWIISESLPNKFTMHDTIFSENADDKENVQRNPDLLVKIQRPIGVVNKNDKTVIILHERYSVSNLISMPT